MKRLFAVTLTAVLAISAPSYASAAVPPMEEPGAKLVLLTDGAIVPASGSVTAECTDSSGCPGSITVDGQTCSLEFGIWVEAGTFVRFGPFVVGVITTDFVCDYGDCGIVTGGGSEIVVGVVL